MGEENRYKDAKIYFNGKEIPYQTIEIKPTNTTNDIDDFGLHFNPDKEASLSCKSCRYNGKLFSKLFGIWDNLKWYQKLWIIITDWFRFRFN